MATSGTATWSPNLLELFEEAFELCGLEMRTDYDVQTARRSFNLLATALANNQLNLWCFSQETLALVAGTASYSLPTDTVDVLDGAIRTNAGSATSQADLIITRTSFSDYVSQTNKLSPGQPTQYSILRGTTQPTVYFWPVPDTAQSYTFYYLRLRRMQDAGSGTGAAAYTADVPFRFYDAVAAGLAYRIACKRPRQCDPVMIQRLKSQYDEALELANSEDRDRSTLTIVPYIGCTF